MLTTFYTSFNSFHATCLFLYPLKTENLGFLMFSGGIEKLSGIKWVNGKYRSSLRLLSISTLIGSF